MKVILKQDVPNLGEAGDIEEVADGYARNYLIPNELAVKVTPGVLKAFKTRQAAQARKRERMEARAESLAEQLSALTLTFRVKAGETGRLYGSITKSDIAEAIEDEIGREVDKREITLPEPIRDLGEHAISVRLMADVEPQIKVMVEPESGEWPEGIKPEGDSEPESE